MARQRHDRDNLFSYRDSYCRQADNGGGMGRCAAQIFSAENWLHDLTQASCCQELPSTSAFPETKSLVDTALSRNFHIDGKSDHGRPW